MLRAIKLAIEKLDELSRKKSLKVVSHFDTDGITSAAIFSRALGRWGRKFSLEIVKNLEEEYIKTLPEDQVLIFLDLASGSLKALGKKNTEVFIFDHHEFTEDVPPNVTLISPQTFAGHEQLSGAAVCYMFARELSAQNKDLATLAVIGMVGDLHEKHIGKIFGEILQDSETIVRKGPMLYPSTRPLDKALEYSSNPYLPGITGNYKGVFSLLRDAGIQNENGKYKALYELTEEEMSRLITAILLRSGGGEINHEHLIGNLFLVKFFNGIEDARELSALINACSRMDQSHVSLGFCLGNKKLKEEAENVYIDYKQSLVAALKYVSEMEKISGPKYTIINAKDHIKDTIIGTVASIISHSPLYPEGSIIVALAYNEDKIKVSARINGKDGRNVREVLRKVVVPMGGEVGGHPNAAGCLIAKEKEGEFIDELRKVLDIELVKV